jgi:predicted nucleic acid-binding Zn ribbon protein
VMPDTATYSFRCPNCEAQYKVVRVEAAPTHNNQLTCLSCGGPLNNREGKFALKYFRTRDGAEPRRKNVRRARS